jgi:hypothetical protein
MGNADTRILFFGNKEVIVTECKCCMAVCKSCPIFSISNHMPRKIPVENIPYYK